MLATSSLKKLNANQSNVLSRNSIFFCRFLKYQQTCQCLFYFSVINGITNSIGLEKKKAWLMQTVIRLLFSLNCSFITEKQHPNSNTDHTDICAKNQFFHGLCCNECIKIVAGRYPFRLFHVACNPLKILALKYYADYRNSFFIKNNLL